MRDYILSCCSTADLSKKHFLDRDIKYICFHFYLDKQEYLDDLGDSISIADFYAAKTKGAETRTSQINITEYEDYFRPFLEEGKDIVHLSLSSGISGSYNSARLAGEKLQEEFPERTLYIIDSLAASSGYGLLVDRLADMRDDGASIDEVYKWTEENKLKMHHWFFTSDLTSLIKGGRVSKTAGFFGGILNICPLMNVDNHGRLIPREKIRTKNRVIEATVEKMKKHAQDGLEYAQKCYLSNAACLDDAQMVVALIEESFPNLKNKIEIYDIGTTIGSHTGQGTVALFFWGDERID